MLKHDYFLVDMEGLDIKEKSHLGGYSGSLGVENREYEEIDVYICSRTSDIFKMVHPSSIILSANTQEEIQERLEDYVNERQSWYTSYNFSYVKPYEKSPQLTWDRNYNIEIAGDYFKEENDKLTQIKEPRDYVDDNGNCYIAKGEERIKMNYKIER